jgi:hypothetical protein
LKSEMIWKIWKKIVKTIRKYRRKLWKDMKIQKKCKLNSEKIWKIQKKIVKRNGKYARKVSWIVIRFGKYGKKWVE